MIKAATDNVVHMLEEAERCVHQYAQVSDKTALE